MSMEHVTADRIVQPMKNTTWRFYAGVVVAGGVTLLGLIAWYYMLTEGLVVTGLRDWGTEAGVSWGVFTGFMIGWVGLAHGGIAVSAGARLLKKDRYKPIARLAELLTIFSLAMVGLLITWHLGRPGQLFKMVPQWPTTVEHSPLTWDMTVVLLYLVLSLTYLILTLRDDLYALGERLPDRLEPLYGLILLGYDPDESEKVEHMAWWLALAILMLVPLLSGGVVPWVFQLMGSQPGWFGAVNGPAMVTGAIAAALGVVMFIGYVARRVYGWEDIIDDTIFAGLAKVDAVVVLVYLYFVVQERLTGAFAAPMPEAEITESLLAGELALIFWSAMGLLVVGFAYFAYQTLTDRVSPALSAGAGLLVMIAIFIEKTRFVVAGLLYPTLMYPQGTYTPSWVEATLVLSTFAMTALGYLLVAKIIPLVEIEEAVSGHGGEQPNDAADAGEEVAA